jgi:hypothetical protein
MSRGMAQRTWGHHEPGGWRERASERVRLVSKKIAPQGITPRELALPIELRASWDAVGLEPTTPHSLPPPGKSGPASDVCGPDAARVAGHGVMDL